MTLLQYLNAFRVYSADALILALGVTLVTSLLKKTVLKKCPKKVYVFLPFVLGFIFCAAFRAIVTLSVEPFTSGLTETLEGGFACGCAATLYYVVYEQFFRPASNKAEALPYPVAQLLGGLVPEESVDALAKELTEGGKGKTGNELFGFVLDTLRGYCAQNAGTIAPAEAELYLYARTISEFLTAVSL